MARSDFQLITATSADIYSQLQKDKFKIDLYHRINGMVINIPPLRERREDIPLLIKSFIKKGPRRVIVDSDTMKYLTDYSWPGNVRELKNVIDSFLLKGANKFKTSDLSEHIIKNNPKQLMQENSFLTTEQKEYLKLYGLQPFLKKIEFEATNASLKECLDDPKKAIDMLRVHKTTFYKIRREFEGGSSWMKH